MQFVKKSILFLSLICAASCTAEDTAPEVSSGDYQMPEISIYDYPVTDGSDSTEPLRTILMCKILGFDYRWIFCPVGTRPGDGTHAVAPDYTCSTEEVLHICNNCLLNSNTHQSFMNLIDDKVELVIAARSISRDEKAYADEKRVTLIEKPIAKDALTFMVNPSNPISNLTVSQIQKIYTGEITNWKEVGGNDEAIKPYVRNRNSGSQEKFETLVMVGLKIADFPPLQVGQLMMSPYYQLEADKQGIGFSPFYYYSVIVNNGYTKAIGLNGVEMTKENVKNGTYPYTTEVYAAVRSDLNRNSKAYELFEFLTTPSGQSIVDESGYVPLIQTSGARGISEMEDAPVSTIYTDIKGVPHNTPRKGIMVKTDVYECGRRQSSKIAIE